MPDHMIVNASPLIFLSRVGGLEWLCNLCSGRVEVVCAVIAEVATGHDGQIIIDAIDLA